MKSIESAIAKKGMEDDVRRMCLNPKEEYLILKRINYENSPDVLGLKTESGKTLYYCASLFDIIESPKDLFYN